MSNGKRGYEPRKILFWKEGKYMGTFTADELSNMVNLQPDSIRRGARNTARKSGKGMYVFRYEDEYYEEGFSDIPEGLEPINRIDDGLEHLRDKPKISLTEMAKEAKRRGITYGALQAEYYAKLYPVIPRR